MKDWILNDLSSPLALLNNLPKCPFAKTAFLEDKVWFDESMGEVDLTVGRLTTQWNNDFMEVAVIKLADDMSPTEITALVDRLNDEYMPRDFIFLDDHVMNEERMYDIVFNNGRYNVLFLQRRSKLEMATKKLARLGYYNNWTKEYYDEVVGWRS